MARERDDASGQFVAEFDPERFVQAIRDLDGAASTTEVAEAVGCDRRTAHLRLTELAEDEWVTNRRVGRAYLWSVAEPEVES
jgi:predicted transcriptional regulator